MKHASHYLLCFGVVIAFPGAGAGRCAAGSTKVTIYSSDPENVWNRVYSALMTRVPEGEEVPGELLDPRVGMLFKDEAACGEATALLRLFAWDESLTKATPLRRAVMQRDLLSIYNPLVARGESGDGWKAPERELMAALAQAVRRVALTTEEIQALPDNYALAVASAQAGKEWEAEKPGPFLPDDLLAVDGAWLLLHSDSSGVSN